MVIPNSEQIIGAPSRVGANLMLAKAPLIDLDYLLPDLDEKLHRHPSPSGIYIVANRVVASKEWHTSQGPLLFYPNQQGIYLSFSNTWVLINLLSDSIVGSEIIWAKDSTVLSGFKVNEDGDYIRIDREQLYDRHDDLQHLLDQASPILELSDIETISSDLICLELEPEPEPEPEQTIKIVSDESLSSGSGWTQSEITACVESYLRMLTMAESNQSINKAAERRRLVSGPLASRTEGSIEFRMQNISSVLDELDIPWLAGYKPLNHVGPAPTQQILNAINHLAPDWIREHQNIEKAEKKQISSADQQAFGINKPEKIPPNIGFDPRELTAFYAPLTRTDDSQVVPESSGINWGQRENRKNKNEAYIIIPSECRVLFPPDGGKITLLRNSTGEQAEARLTQQNMKALQTNPIEILGKWLRDWIGVPSGIKVTFQHLGTKYTRVRIRRLSNDLFVIEI